MPPASWVEHVPFAFWIVDGLRPASFVELGTQSGNSYSAFAQAVHTLGMPTSCYAVDTWRGDAQTGFYDESVFTEWSAFHDWHFAAFSRLVRSTFAEAAAHFADGSIDLLHIDGCHTYEALTADLELWRPKVSRRGVILIHDINVRESDFGAWRAWEDVREQSPSFEFLHGHGLGVLGVGPDLPEPVHWLLSRRMSPEDVNAVRQYFSRLGASLSSQLAADAASKPAEADTAAAAREVGNLKAELAREQDEHHQMLRRQWEAAATLQDVVREHMERQRGLEQDAASLASDLAVRDRWIADAAQRMSRLEDAIEHERQGRADAMARNTQLTAGFEARLRAESDRWRQSEIERDAIAAARTSRITLTGRFPRLRRKSRRGLRRLRTALSTPAALRLIPAPGRRLSPSAIAFVRHPGRLREAYLIAGSGLFDEAFYRLRYADVARSRLSPLAHFVLLGSREGRDPHPLFDSAYYIRQNPDVAAAGLHPLLHYRTQGAFEGRNPHPLFSVAYYLAYNPDVKAAGVEPLTHFLRFGAADGRNPNPLFDSAYYLEQYPDVAASGINPLVHFALDGWREGRRPSAGFNTAHYLATYADVRQRDINPLSHYLESGQFEGRRVSVEAAPAEARVPDANQLPQARVTARSRGPRRDERPAILCLSHVMPLPPRAGNEYRIYRMLRWLRDKGYRVVPVIAPLPGDRVGPESLEPLADEFPNAVLCDRDGRIDYVLRDVPDVLASMDREFVWPVSTLVDQPVASEHERALLRVDRTFCHDALITTALRLHGVLGRYILLNEYIWMSRILPLIPRHVPKVIDTIDVFSTKREKVLQYGVQDLHVDAREEAKRLRDADLIIAIQENERRELEQLVPGKRVVTAGVDFDVVEDAGRPSGRRVLYVASDNPMNRKALADFLRFAWPHVRRTVVDAELVVAGKVSRSLEIDVPGVIRLGTVGDLQPLYAQCRAVINPAVAGTGLKIKTLEALGYLRPIVTWPSGTDGFAPELARFCVTVQDRYEFSRRVADILAAPEPRLFSRAERDDIVRLMSPETAYRALTQAFEALLAEPSRLELAEPVARD